MSSARCGFDDAQIFASCAKSRPYVLCACVYTTHEGYVYTTHEGYVHVGEFPVGSTIVYSKSGGDSFRSIPSSKYPPNANGRHMGVCQIATVMPT